MLVLQTGRAHAATILVGPMGTIEVLRVREGQLQFAYSGNTCKQLRMGNTSFTHRCAKLLFDSILPYDISK